MTLTSLFELSHWNAFLTYNKTVDDAETTITSSGLITDLTLPTLEREMDTTKRAGELGVIPRPSYFNELELSFTVKSIYKDFIEALSVGSYRLISIKSVACLVNDDGSSIPYMVKGTGFTKSLPLGNLTGDGVESEYSMGLTELEAMIGKDGENFYLDYKPRDYRLFIGTRKAKQGSPGEYDYTGIDVFENIGKVILTGEAAETATTQGSTPVSTSSSVTEEE